MLIVKNDNRYLSDVTRGQYAAISVGRTNLMLFLEIFTPDFISNNTDFETLDDLIKESGFRIETVEDISLIPERAWDEFIADHTRFPSWESMQQVAFLERANRN